MIMMDKRNISRVVLGPGWGALRPGLGLTSELQASFQPKPLAIAQPVWNIFGWAGHLVNWAKPSWSFCPYFKLSTTYFGKLARSVLLTFFHFWEHKKNIFQMHIYWVALWNATMSSGAFVGQEKFMKERRIGLIFYITPFHACFGAVYFPHRRKNWIYFLRWGWFLFSTWEIGTLDSSPLQKLKYIESGILTVQNTLLIKHYQTGPSYKGIARSFTT